MAAKKDRMRICVREGDIHYKVTSLYLMSDGGFKLDVPYCSHERGAVEKWNIPENAYSKMHFSIPRSEATSFIVRNRPQLSIHPSGFVQFSGPGITSGIDKETGKHKGLAIQTLPLTTPINTGPTCGVVFWGLKEGYATTDKFDDLNFVIPKEVFAYHPTKKGEEANAYHLEFWVFPADEYYERTIRKDPLGNEYMALRFPNFLPAPNTAFVMRVVRLKSIRCFLALLPRATHTKFAAVSPFGFHLNSPAEKTAKGWTSLHAMSPIPDGYLTEQDLPSLDRI